MTLYRIPQDPIERGDLTADSHLFVMESVRDNFPCYFAKAAMLQSAMFASAIDIEWPTSPESIYELLSDYIAAAARESHKTVLIASVKVEAESLDDHERAFWQILKYCKERDGPLPTRDQFCSPFWTYAIGGVPLFVTGHSQFYRNRLSRSAPKGLFLVIQPKENLARIFQNEGDYERITRAIRTRVDLYDKIERSPRLGSARTGSFPDITQFWLPDTNLEGSDMAAAKEVWFNG